MKYPSVEIVIESNVKPISKSRNYTTHNPKVKSTNQSSCWYSENGNDSKQVCAEFYERLRNMFFNAVLF